MGVAGHNLGQEIHKGIAEVSGEGLLSSGLACQSAQTLQ